MIGLMGGVVAFLVDCFFWFPLHLSSNLSLFWLFIGLTMVMGIEKNTGSGSVSKSKRNSIYKFKPVLYIVIVILAVFLCVTVFRPFMARIVWYSGFKEVEKENWEKAAEIYESALKWDPYEGGLYYDRGKIFMESGLYNTALINFKESGKYFDLRGLPQNLAIIYLAKGETDNAITELKRAISYQLSEGTMPPLYSELGNTYLKLERYEEAEAAFKEALKIDPNLVSAHYGLAGAYLKQNLSNEALIELQKVIELAPDSQEAKHARDAIQKIEQAKSESQPTN